MADLADAKVVLRGPPMLPPPDERSQSNVVIDLEDATAEVRGLRDMLRRVAAPPSVEAALSHDLSELGALDVRELSQADLNVLPSRPSLRPLQRRRLLSACV